MIKTSPLQLERYYIADIEVRAKIGFQPKAAPSVFALSSEDISIEDKIFGHKDDQDKMLCELTVTSLPSAVNCPYNFNIRIVGFFKVGASSEQERQKLVRFAEPTLLYSVAREVILSQSERGPFPGVLLPIVTFSADASTPQAAPSPKVPQGASR